jgi:hypothetical protein
MQARGSLWAMNWVSIYAIRQINFILERINIKLKKKSTYTSYLLQYAGTLNTKLLVRIWSEVWTYVRPERRGGGGCRLLDGNCLHGPRLKLREDAAILFGQHPNNGAVYYRQAPRLRHLT